MLYDDLCLDKITEAPDLAVSWVLMAAYLYYIRDEVIVSDQCYDKLVRELRSNQDNIRHPHKSVLPADFWTADTTTLCGLTAQDYPIRTRSAACSLAKIAFKENM